MTAAASHRSFRESLAERNHQAARLCAVIAAVLMPAGMSLDLVTQPTYAWRFLVYRLLGTAIALLFLGLTYTKWSRRHAFLVGLGPVLACALPIQAMIQDLGGFSSPYYAGLNLCILGVGVIFTWSMVQTILASSTVIAVWLVPALVQGPQDDPGTFFNNFYFLALTGVIAVASNASRYRYMRREFEAVRELAATSEKLSSALERLRELDRLKSEFFANISHELRTPLTLILSPVEERLVGLGDTEDRRLFEVIRRNALRLLRLIDDLLDLSRIDAGRLRLQIGPVDLPLLAEQAIEAFHPAATAKQIEVVADFEGRSEGLFGDPHRLEMILTNLLGNALKFTPPQGRIRVALRRRRGEVVLSVADTGPGIPSGELERIFDRFHQVEGSARRHKEGAGIGLALARELAELHGGRLEVESTLGRGSTFHLILPLGRAHFRPEVVERRKVALDVRGGRRASDQPPADGEDAILPDPTPPPEEPEEVLLEGGRRPRILIAEDHVDLREFLRSLLARHYEVTVAADGSEALEKVRAERPDIVLSDVMMPHMTGMDLCAAIKGDEGLRNTPFILLTARGGSEAVVEGYAAGADDFVSKPVHPRVLLARIRAQLRLRSLSLQLAQQERLAAVGTLAAGVGHEVRNPVNAVLNGARALLASPATDGTTRRVLEVIEDAGRRIEGISAALLDHANPAEQDRPRPFDVRAGIDATLRLLEHRTRTVQVHRMYATDRQVVASAAELNQVFLNLLDNALRSSAKNVWVRVEEKDGRVRVGVDDDGPGVPRAIANRVFDPFFTTRGPGEGTGLGLYLSRKIVDRYGGKLALGTRDGGGASFSIDLPAEEGE